MSGRPGRKSCCYSGCPNTAMKNKENLYYFIPFPKPCFQYRRDTYKESSKTHRSQCITCCKCETWIRLCRPKFGMSMDIPAKAFICSMHFEAESGPTAENPNPKPVPKKRKELPLRTSLQEKYAKTTTDCSTLPSVLSDICSINTISIEKSNEITSASSAQLKVEQRTVDATTQTVDRCHCGHQPQYLTQESQTDKSVTCAVKTTLVQSRSAQTTLMIFPYMRLLNKYKRQCAELKQKLKKKLQMLKFDESVKRNEKKCQYYTGLTFKDILTLMTFLGPVTQNLNYWKSHKTNKTTCKPRQFSPLQELLITLLRLRRGLPVRDIAYRFGISSGYVSKLTTTWIQLLYHKFLDLKPHMFPSRKVIAETLPALFKNLPNIRVIVDGTEFFCQAPGDFAHQGNLYSSYKAHTTFKVLIGCTPNGAISYVSELYEGAISDRQLFEQCGIKDLLEPGDLVLADRGFTVQDIVEERGASLNIPAFMKGRERLTVEEELETKRIAKERIYVEHVIGRLKRFRLLTTVIPLNFRGLLSQTVFVCACLVNFQSPIILD